MTWVNHGILLIWIAAIGCFFNAGTTVHFANVF